MTIKLLAIGKTDHKNLQLLIDEYQKRLSFYIKFELIGAVNNFYQVAFKVV